MTPTQREYLIYGIAVIVGFLVYLGLERGLGLDFAIAFLCGFVAIHASIVAGRYFIRPR